MLFIGLSSFPTRLVIIIFDSIDFPIVIRKKKKSENFLSKGKEIIYRHFITSILHVP